MASHERQSFRCWASSRPPARILVVRLHAIGDVGITFPWCRALRKSLPATRVDYLTSAPTASLVTEAGAGDEVISLPLMTSRAERLWRTTMTGLFLRRRGYDMVIDLQRNWVSRYLRLLIRPVAWGEFDRFSPLPAGERVERVFRRIGMRLEPTFPTLVTRESRSRAASLLAEGGWDGLRDLILLNPAGLWPSRNWPMSSYVELGKLFLEHSPVQFLFLGTERIAQKAAEFALHHPTATVNLVGRTTLSEAFSLLQHASAVVSEDSGLMHLSWGSGIPTVALLGSTDHRWSAPLGEHSACLHSGDLPCGACKESLCAFGDVHCLTRYSARQVFDLVQRVRAHAATVAP